MEITKIKYFPVERTSDNHPLAACSVVLDGVFMVHDVKIYAGGIVVMPQRSLRGRHFTSTNGHKSNDLCHPVDKKFFEELKSTILTGFALFESTGEVCFIP